MERPYPLRDISVLFCFHELIFYYFMNFSYQSLPIIFPRSLSDSKSPQVSRTLLSILADLNNDVVWMVNTPLLISESSNHCTKHLVTVPGAPIMTDNTLTFLFHSVFSFLARYRYLSLYSLSFNISLGVTGTTKSAIRQALFFSHFIDYL